MEGQELTQYTLLYTKEQTGIEECIKSIRLAEKSVKV